MKDLNLKATPALLAALAWPLVSGAALAILAAAAFPATAAAQTRAPAGPVKNWGSLFVVAYPDAGTVHSPIEGTTDEEVWNFGSGFGLGAAAQHVFGQGLQLGVEGSFAPSVGVEITQTVGGAATATTSGHAKLAHLMATGRIMTGGGAGLGLYLAGGAGVFLWGMPAPTDRWDPDLAFRTAAGLEYQLSQRRGIFLEWGQFWAFHQHSGVKSNTAKFSQIRGGLRIGW